MSAAEELALDPAVRAAVFATVTVREAYGILHSRPGKPWCDAFLLNFAEGMDDVLNDPQAESIADSARKVIGVTIDDYRPKGKTTKGKR